MWDCCFKVIAIKTVIILICYVVHLRADETIQKLPFCNPQFQDLPNFSDLIIVSTIDGKVTAFSTDKGIKAWDLETQPLLSSNLHHLELTSSGKLVRLVPSLRGSLYSLSGDSIEPLPFDAEQLLSSSFKYSDDLVIAGARDTRWLGVDARTGSVLYECNSSGCNSEKQTASAGQDILVLRRHSNTVRALDPRTGTEKWNFSVADHQMALSRRECAGSYPPQVEVEIGVSLPEGVVAVRGSDNSPLWQQKLEAPVADVWRLQGGLLRQIDVLWEATRAIGQSKPAAGPSLYLGVHDTQLYIQESLPYVKKLETSILSKPVPLKLKQTRPLLTDGGADLAVSDAEPSSLTAVTLHGAAATQDKNGFFLYLPETCDQEIKAGNDDIAPDAAIPNTSDDRPEYHHVHVHVYSLWFWWKEVCVIAISSALLMNLMIWPRFFPPKLRPSTPLAINKEYIVVEKHYDRPANNNNTDYRGRFDNDFEPLMCLGKGGFGVVFEAKNKIDHCSYAVKRITLPRTESKRERVLREVRALAKLEHEHIVRYFNAWVEEPPPAWQETWDQHWMKKLGDISEVLSDECRSRSRTFNSSKPSKSGSVMLNLNKELDVVELDRKRFRSLSCSDSFIIDFEEKSSRAPVTQDDITNSSDNPSQCSVSKNTCGDNDDSFIVFEKSHEMASDATNKTLDNVKSTESQTRNSIAKKKGHTRHWSLDMCVSPEGSKMYLYIQMQLCQSDSLHDWLRKRENYCWEKRREQVKTLFRQIVSAVEYVHLAGLIHRDLKPSNIFFAQDGRVKIGDFGLVTTMTDNLQDGEPQEAAHQPRHTSRVGTHLYMSPEQLAGRAYSYKVDIYSLGMVLFELLHPFGTESERVACLMGLRRGCFPKQFCDTHPSETDLLKLMLNGDPNERPTASGVKARAPLYEATDDQWHFRLPTLVGC